jgi:hypothetical protein
MNTAIASDECDDHIDCDDDDRCTVDTCSGVPKRCHNEHITTCRDGDGCCPGHCTYLEDNDCSSEQYGEPFYAQAVTDASSNNPHSIAVFYSFYYDPDDNVNHGNKVERGILDDENSYLFVSEAPEPAILIVTILPADSGVQDQIITSTIDEHQLRIYLPEEDPYIVTGEDYYVSTDGSTYYMLYGGHGRFMAPDEAFVPENAARLAED